MAARRFPHLKAVLCGTAVYAGFLLLARLWRLPCVFQWLFGVPCPGCGITRALLAAMHLQWRSAFSLHPLFPLALPFLFCAVHTNAPFLRGRARPFVVVFLVCCTLLFFAIYALRMLHGQIP